jgi:AraC family transcriptional regulator of adaptative response/methylated-DNA-[protein]-cysteine methyltransferase
LLAITDRGICYFGFVDDDNRSGALNQLFESWPGADFTENPESIKPIIKDIFKADHINKSKPFNLIVKGTNFQTRVWRALLSVPEGWVVSYQDIASFIGEPESYRAVANAVAINPIAFLIPCHRVITKSGIIHNYRWGSARKKAIIGWEAARAI